MNHSGFLAAGCSAMQLSSAENNTFWLRTCDLHESIYQQGSHLVSIPAGEKLFCTHGRIIPTHSICGITYNHKDTWLLDGIQECGGDLWKAIELLD